MTVSSPRAESIVSSPPTNSIRSRMPSSPNRCSADARPTQFGVEPLRHRPRPPRRRVPSRPEERRSPVSPGVLEDVRRAASEPRGYRVVSTATGSRPRSTPVALEVYLDPGPLAPTPRRSSQPRSGGPRSSNTVEAKFQGQVVNS